MFYMVISMANIKVNSCKVIKKSSQKLLRRRDENLHVYDINLHIYRVSYCQCSASIDTMAPYSSPRLKLGKVEI